MQARMKLSPAFTPWLHGLALAAYAGLVTFLSLLPAKSVPNLQVSIPHLDKLVHFTMYAGMAAVLCWVSQPKVKEYWKLLAVILVAAGYGFGMELLQLYITPLRRSFEFADAATNTAGSAVYVLCWAMLHKPHHPLNLN